MKIKNLPDEFEKARPVMQKIESAGYEAYFVGGSVRDTIIGEKIHDVDIASSAYPEEIKKLFKRTVDTGIEHGTVMVLDNNQGYEITTFRTESGYQDYRRPDKVTFVRSLKEDLKRRDFTINALAMRENGEVTDLFGGIEDIDKKIIRAVGNPNERFNEDALRMMRAVRFASKLNFNIEKETFNAIERHSSLLEKISIERIYVEFIKMMKGLKPKQGIDDMISTNMYLHVPLFADYRKQLSDISRFKNLNLNNEIEIWSLICFEFGLNREQISNFLKSWKASNEVINNTQTCCYALNAIKNDNMSDFLMYLTGENLLLEANYIASFYDCSIDNELLKKQYSSLPIKNKKQLAINGGILIKNGILKPGPMLGKVLNAIEKQVVIGNLDNNTENIINFTKQYLKE
ncbi:CCA tRNA nucleotidyltransferase [Apilactobacillus timberlakei]|uniref:CCA tRNA nucleotidyltransferase n=1 Tax=Apilactobacillus timberlakei TaxID=2008380 RepID=UPI00112ADFF9|nr:CCA tRNA nucleotidyltransferase [Apilactobacillus timberlakei]TPR24178.1 CCA tRNA nucleotidyltransferase [Apilactobacillus timberlakei]